MEEVPAPKKLAPYSAALTAETVEAVGTTPIATGRFVVLHDPNGQDAWDGDFRIVVQARARIDDEVGMDPVFESAAWSWLTDGLEDSRAGYRALVGTVTRVLSETFGGLTLTDSCAHAEIRASWTPTTTHLGPHLTAWHNCFLGRAPPNCFLSRAPPNCFLGRAPPSRTPRDDGPSHQPPRRHRLPASPGRSAQDHQYSPRPEPGRPPSGRRSRPRRR